MFLKQHLQPLVHLAVQANQQSVHLVPNLQPLRPTSFVRHALKRRTVLSTKFVQWHCNMALLAGTGSGEACNSCDNRRNAGYPIKFSPPASKSAGEAQGEWSLRIDAHTPHGWEKLLHDSFYGVAKPLVTPTHYAAKLLPHMAANELAATSTGRCTVYKLKVTDTSQQQCTGYQPKATTLILIVQATRFMHFVVLVHTLTKIRLSHT